MVASAAKAVGMSVASAYALRKRAGAESFAAAWDTAMDVARDRVWDAVRTIYATAVSSRSSIAGRSPAPRIASRTACCSRHCARWTRRRGGWIS